MISKTALLVSAVVSASQGSRRRGFKNLVTTPASVTFHPNWEFSETALQEMLRLPNSINAAPYCRLAASSEAVVYSGRCSVSPLTRWFRAGMLPIRLSSGWGRPELMSHPSGVLVDRPTHLLCHPSPMNTKMDQCRPAATAVPRPPSHRQLIAGTCSRAGD